MPWWQKLILVFKDRQLRNKILFVLAMLAVFRFAASVPVLAVDTAKLKDVFGSTQALGLLDLFVGGTLSNMSIVMLGLGPYITSTIIMQLLTMIFPQLERMYKEEGEEGRQKINKYSRLLTVPLAAVQSFSMLLLLQKRGAITSLTSFQTTISVLTVTGGSVFLMWLGELISEKGIGNGVSLLIFAGILARTPVETYQFITSRSTADIPASLFFFAVALAIIAGVVFVTEARRNIPVSYAKRIRGHRVYGGASTYLPININPAGVIPIIFALSILVFPSMIAGFFAGGGGALANFMGLVVAFLQNPWIYGVLFFFLVVLFTFFYTAVTFDPKAISNNLQKMGGFIPGIRPGERTAQFLHKILYRILFVGALFLGTIAVLPSIIQGATDVGQFQFLIGGTALLIVVSVVLDTWRQVRSQMEMREYESF